MKHGRVLPTLWMERAADLVEDDIRRRSAGEAWPINRCQLHNVCKCYSLILGICPEVPKAGLFREEVLLVKDRGEEVRVMRTAMHELAERLIVAGQFPSIRWRDDANMPHKLADIVADRYARFLRFVFAGQEDAQLRRAQADAARANQPELTRELDEWAETSSARNHTHSGRQRDRKTRKSSVRSR